MTHCAPQATNLSKESRETYSTVRESINCVYIDHTAMRETKEDIKGTDTNKAMIKTVGDDTHCTCNGELEQGTIEDVQYSQTEC